MIHRMATPELVGRRAELDFLLERFASVEGGHGGTVCVTGDAGIGKSRLVHELGEAIDSSVCWKATGQCLEYAPAPYHPFTAATRALFEIHADRGKLVEAPLKWLLSQSSVTLAAGAIGEVNQRKLEAFEDVCDALRALARVRPLVIVIEDMHWADAGSMELLQFAIPRLETARILVIATWRVGKIALPEGAPSFLERLDRLGASRLNLAPLDRLEIRAVVLRLLRGRITLPAETIERIEELADGNPLYAEELARSAVMRRGVGAQTRPQIPASLNATVVDRLKQLDPQLKSIVVHASVIGKRFGLAILSAIAERPEPIVLEALHQARDLQLVVEDDAQFNTYAFTHELVREAIYQQLLVGEALPVHRRVAEQLEDAPDAADRVAELAYHWAAARIPEKAVRYNVSAGEVAMRVHSFRDAVRFYRRALTFAEGRSDRGSLCERLATALYTDGVTSDAKRWMNEAIRAFETAGDGRRFASALLRLAKLEFFEANIDASVALAMRALESLSATEPSSAEALLEALTEVVRYLTISGRGAEATAYLDRAQQIARRHGMHLPAHFYDTRAIVHARLGSATPALKDFRRAADLADQSGDIECRLRVWSNIGYNASWLGNADISVSAYRKTLDLCERDGFHVRNAFSALGFAAATLRLGRLNDARTLVRTALAKGISAPLNRLVLAEVGIPLALMLDDSALLAQAEDEWVLEKALSISSSWTAPVASAFAQLALHRGQREKAAGILHAALAQTPAMLHASWLLVQVAADGYSSDVPLARAVFDRSGSTRTTVAGEAHLQLFEAHVAARDGLRSKSTSRAGAAADLFAQLGWPVFAARALELSGQIARAATLYNSIGCIADVRRTSEMLERKRRGRTGDTLTAREAQVAHFVTAGQPNKAVARSLGISERTVSHHLESIFNRLGITSRAQLAARILGTSPDSAKPDG